MSAIILSGTLDEKHRCTIYSSKHRCKRKAKWLLFYHGPKALNTTQFSNLAANVCSDHIEKAVNFMDEWQKKKEATSSDAAMAAEIKRVVQA